MLPAMPKSEIIRFDHKQTPTGKSRILRGKSSASGKRKTMQSQNKSRYQTVPPGVKRSASAAS